LRISLGGGGTDLSSYYQEHEGFLIAAAIDKYVYVNVTKPFAKGIFLKYSQLENVKKIEEVQHPIIKEALGLLNLKAPQIELTALADIPSGTGLGSSGSFTTALLKALYAHERRHLHPKELAELACHVEIDLLKEPVGKQDQYIAAIGGITCFTFQKNNKVTSTPLNIDAETMYELEDNLLLFFTGYSRNASDILRDQKEKSKLNDSDMLANLHFVKDLGLRSKIALETGNLQAFGELMREHWENKKRRSAGMSNSKIDEWHDIAMRNGAIGGKVVGAGGGGFLMFLANDPKKLKKAMNYQGLEEVRFNFDFEGTKILSAS
jgi:D-glycero-alpha-D-manno-heptose-7-phosphate kinase